MAGEMSASDVTRDEYPLHFALADTLGHGASVEPFDVYQGPYVLFGGQRLWLCDGGNDNGVAHWFNESTNEESRPFFVGAHSNVSTHMGLAVAPPRNGTLFL